jgi:hypothetical protein
MAGRIATAAARERLAPGLMTEGYAVNALSVPELWTGVETADVPPGDVSMIERVAIPAPAGASRARPPTERIDHEEAARLLVNRTVAADAYAGQVRISPARRHLAAGMIAQLEVEVRNLGSEHWPPAHQDEPPIRLTYRWLAADGEAVLEPEGLRTPFEETVKPGESTIAMLAVKTPSTPGDYVLEVDVVHELVRWFDCAERMSVTVEPLDAPPSPDGTSGLARPDRNSRREAQVGPRLFYY